jgi:tetratricopeptide (TPR) repeat protein
MLLPLLLLLQSVPAAPRPLPTISELRYEECITLAAKDPAGATVEAQLWMKENGGFLAQECLATAMATDFRFDQAAAAFATAAKGAEAAKDNRAAAFWAQAGNAAIAADKPDEALMALEAALALPALNGPERGDVLIDKARALVAAGREKDADAPLAQARTLAPENGIGWLLSATLARRLGALSTAQGYITTAASLLPREPAIALEAGNIAQAAGNAEAARRAWQQVVSIAPDSRQANTARARLAETAPATPAPTPPAPSPTPGAPEIPVQSR